MNINTNYAKQVDGIWKKGLARKLKPKEVAIPSLPSNDILAELLLFPVADIAHAEAWQVSYTVTPFINNNGNVVVEEVRDMTDEEAAAKVDIQITARQAETTNALLEEGSDTSGWSAYIKAVNNIRSLGVSDLDLLKDLSANIYWAIPPKVYTL